MLIAISFMSRKKGEAADPASILKIEAADQNYSFKITRLQTDTDTEGITGADGYGLTPEIGKTCKIYLSGTGLTSRKISYKGELLKYLVAPGSGINQDFLITD